MQRPHRAIGRVVDVRCCWCAVAHRAAMEIDAARFGYALGHANRHGIASVVRSAVPASEFGGVLHSKSTLEPCRVPTGCVVSYMEKECRGAGQNVALDFDVTNGFGPETITLHQMMAGQYKLLINKYSGSNSLRTSGATVKERLPSVHSKCQS